MRNEFRHESKCVHKLKKQEDEANYCRDRLFMCVTVRKSLVNKKENAERSEL